MVLGSSIIVYADYREEKSGIPRLLESTGISVRRVNLSIGDYLISNDIVIERKTAYDFVHSLFDGRLFDQARRMSEEYPTIIYVVEGNPLRLKRYQGRTKQILAAMTALTIDFGARILYSNGPSDTAVILESIVKRLEGYGREAIVIHKKPRIDTLREWQLYILQAFPYIGVKTAKRILEYYGSLRDFCNTSLSELARIEGIGEKKAERILQILNARLPRTGKSKKRTLEDFY